MRSTVSDWAMLAPPNTHLFKTYVLARQSTGGKHRPTSAQQP
jgi:hypothetical protein